MSSTKSDQPTKAPKPKTLVTHLVAGGAAGLIEACTCHPLDTIKVRMQLSKSGARNAAVRIIQFVRINMNV